MPRSKSVNPSGREGLSLRDIRYRGQVPTVADQLKCHIGYDAHGRDICIYINPDQLPAKKIKYPNLHVFL